MVRSMDTARSQQPASGLDLKLARIARGVSQRELARRMGVSPQRIAAIEATRWPTRGMCARYMAALETATPRTSETRPAVGQGDRS